FHMEGKEEGTLRNTPENFVWHPIKGLPLFSEGLCLLSHASEDGQSHTHTHTHTTNTHQHTHHHTPTPPPPKIHTPTTHPHTNIHTPPALASSSVLRLIFPLLLN